MSTDPDLQMILADIRQDFIDNTRDKLDDLEEEIEALRQGDANAEQRILEVKRVIHSIKGAGGSFGFPTISKVAHGLEDYLETTGDVSTVAAEDLMVFINTITDILIAGDEPDHEMAHMMLRSLPTGRRQSGARALDKGSALMLMPRGVQRKIISQELAQLGYKVTIVEKAVEFKLGARGLRSICEAIITDAMFDIPSQPDVKNFEVTKSYAEEKFDKSKFNQLKVA